DGLCRRTAALPGIYSAKRRLCEQAGGLRGSQAQARSPVEDVQLPSERLHPREMGIAAQAGVARIRIIRKAQVSVCCPVKHEQNRDAPIFHLLPAGAIRMEWAGVPDVFEPGVPDAVPLSA